MDLFTDVDLLCDLMEASNKRRVPVYILLDEKKLSYFSDMCSTLDIQNSHLSVSVFWILNTKAVAVYNGSTRVDNSEERQSFPLIDTFKQYVPSIF